jgi:hypothetical protein
MLNNLQNVTILPVAVASQSGQAVFETGESSYTGRISDQGAQNVKIISLDGEITAGLLPIPDVLKIDVEGAELLVLKGAEKTIAQRRPAIFLSTHGPEKHSACKQLLASFGYQIEGLPSTTENVPLDFIAFEPVLCSSKWLGQD